MVKVTCVPDGVESEQVKLTLLPPCIVQVPAELGVTVTMPLLSTDVPEIGVVHTVLAVNVAVTAAAELKDAIVQVATAPLQTPPLQPVKVEPAVGAAVKVTLDCDAKLAEHVAPQLIPAGALVTVPVPAPALVTVTL